VSADKHTLFYVYACIYILLWKWRATTKEISVISKLLAIYIYSFYFLFCFILWLGIDVVVVVVVVVGLTMGRLVSWSPSTSSHFSFLAGYAEFAQKAENRINTYLLEQSISLYIILILFFLSLFSVFLVTRAPKINILNWRLLIATRDEAGTRSIRRRTCLAFCNP